MSFKNVGGLEYSEKNNLAQNRFLAVEISTLLGRITSIPGVASLTDGNTYQGKNVFNSDVEFAKIPTFNGAHLNTNDNSTALATTAWVTEKTSILLQWDEPDL